MRSVANWSIKMSLSDVVGDQVGAFFAPNSDVKVYGKTPKIALNIGVKSGSALDFLKNIF